jgi:hypothetical protein
MAHQIPFKNFKIRGGVTFQVSEDLVCSVSFIRAVEFSNECSFLKELVAVNCGDGLHRKDDVGADGERNGSDMRNYLRPGSF